MVQFVKVKNFVREKIVVMRPGALGDVIATRSLLSCVRAVSPDALIALAAPGERGGFLARHGLADAFLDWDSRDLAWLFTASGENPSERLRGFFGDASLILAFLGRRNADFSATFQSRLRRLAHNAAIVVAEAIPPANAGYSVYEWLCRPFLTYSERENFTFPRCCSERIRIDAVVRPVRRYAVIHPGSGGKAKNWPVENYARVAEFLGKLKVPGENSPYFSTLYVTEGEADAGLGEQLCHAVPGAQLVSVPSLDGLAALLANAAMYIGNDSGVSHLAAAVENAQGEYPDTVVIFGPSSSTIWQPPAAHVLEAGEAMDLLDPEIVCAVLTRVTGESHVN